jgi:hypothetical protein
MPRKKLAKKNAGGGAGDVPLRRSYEREALEQRGKYPDPREVKPTDRTTSKEAMKMTAEADLGPLGQAILALDEKGIRPQFHVGEDGVQLSATLKEGDHGLMKLSVPEDGEPEVLEISADLVPKFAGTPASLDTEEEISLSNEPTVKEVEEYMAAHDLEFGAAVRQLATERASDHLRGETISPHVDVNKENRELRAAIEERGALDKDYRDTLRFHTEGGYDGRYDLDE